VQVNLPGGSLFVRVEQDFASVWMRGPAVMVYRGELPGINSQA
jgi:diaminopimelate epimerase